MAMPSFPVDLGQLSSAFQVKHKLVGGLEHDFYFPQPDWG